MLQSSVLQAVYRVRNEFPDPLTGKCLASKRKASFLNDAVEIAQYVRIMRNISPVTEVNRTNYQDINLKIMKGRFCGMGSD
ncbi:hypothetical protein KXR87_02805 [Yokenella regensburgei]|uniref:hypothetical protein n=1 Tax=Yokenella regensburgei TaxID=158877 RepID=UPI003F18C1BC